MTDRTRGGDPLPRARADAPSSVTSPPSTTPTRSLRVDAPHAKATPADAWPAWTDKGWWVLTREGVARG